jgi:hypothetical protein
MTLKSFQLLKQFWHDKRYDIRKVRVFYVDRGAPEDLSSVGGGDLKEVDSKFYLGVITATGVKEIPYHRMTRIEYDGKCVWDRINLPAADQNLIFGNDFLSQQKKERQQET